MRMNESTFLATENFRPWVMTDQQLLGNVLNATQCQPLIPEEVNPSELFGE